MGKYSDAFAKGRASAKDERQKKKHQNDADRASPHCSRAHMGQTVCLSRRSEGERRFGKRRAGGQFRWRANRCRRRSDADGLKNWHAPAHPLRAIETTQIDCLRGPRRWTCLDESRWSRSEGAWQLAAVKSAKIEELLVTMLTEIGRDLGSVQAAPAARPEMPGLIALAVLGSPAARQIFDRLGYR